MQGTRKTLILGLVMVALVAGGFWKYVLAPKRVEVADLRAQTETSQTQLVQQRAKVAEYTKAKETFREDFRTVKRLGKAVPNDDNVRTLLLELDRAARDGKVDFRAIGLGGDAAASQAGETSSLPPGALVGTAGFPTIPFTFEFRGSYKRLAAFFGDLDANVKMGKGSTLRVSGRLLKVDAFSLEPSDKGFKTLTASIRATAFLLPGADGNALGAEAQAADLGAPAASAASADTSGSAAPPVSSSIGVVR